MVCNDLKDTTDLMISTDYKERFAAEYYQTKIRCEKLKSMLDKYLGGTLQFKPTCPYNLLFEQYVYMCGYLECLKKRMALEGVDLTCEASCGNVGFKTGDIIAMTDTDNYTYVGIFHGYNGDSVECYAILNACGNVVPSSETDSSMYRFKEFKGIRRATVEEEKKFFNVLQKEGRFWNSKKKCIESINTEECRKEDFHPFDKVLVRDDDDDDWEIDIFSRIGSGSAFRYWCVGGRWYRRCIPYEGNEKFLGTTETPVL